ncbi:MAG: ATP-binding protein [Thiotrichaceae bacterium]|nr:ATP-binding protein [Thiotrichaceae bacterium]
MRYQKYATVVILILAFSLFILGYIVLKHRQQAWLEHEFVEITQHQSMSIQHNLQQHFQVLKSYSAFFSTYPQAKYNDFKNFADVIHSEQQDSLLALHWIPRVSDAKRSDYEKILKQTDSKQQIWHKNQTNQLIPAPKQTEYFPVLFTISNQSSELLNIGLDLTADKLLWKNLKHASEIGIIYTSEPLTLKHPLRPPQQVILLIQPVYQTPLNVQTIQQRQQYLQGFIVGVFDIQKLLNSALQHLANKNILVRLKIPVKDRAVYVHQAYPYEMSENFAHKSLSLLVAGRVWEVQAFVDISNIHKISSTWLEAILFLSASFLILLIISLFFQYLRYLESIKKSQRQLAEYNSQLANKVNQSGQALHESHERLKTILNSLEAMVCVVDMDTYEVLFANKALKYIHGVGDVEGEICWKSFHSNLEEPCDFCTNKQLINKSGQPTGLYTWEYCNPYTGNWYLMQDRAIPWTDGRIVRLEIATDITERKEMEVILRESEQYRRTLIEESTIGLVLINMDDNGSFSEVNSAFANSLGYKVEEMINSVTFWDLTPEEYHPSTHKQQIILKQTGRFGPYEKAYLHKDGHHVPIRLSGLLIKHKGCTFIWANVEDTTYQKRAQEAEAAKVIAEQANRAKSICLTNMSHELRTPLNAVLGYTQILSQSNNLTPEQYEGLSIIQHSSEYLLNLIDDIMDISKVEAGKLELLVEDFNFESFIKNVVDLFRVRALQKSIEFIYQPLENAPYLVYSDEKRLRQILINLLSNAVKFTPEHGCVTLALLRISENKVQFKIRDTGIGIASEEISKIFMPFQQVGESDAHAEGAGLGLAITQNLIKLLNADLQVNSVLGQGTEFCVTMTLPESHSTETLQNNDIMGYQGSLKTLLIADKVWEYRTRLKNFLSPLNFNLLEADSIHALFDKLSQKPDVLLIDINLLNQLPADSLAQDNVLQHIPLIVTTEQGLSYVETAINYQALLTKPYDKSAVLASLKHVLDLIWIMQKNEAEQANNLDMSLESGLINQHYPLSAQQIHQLYNLSMMGDIKGILNFAQQLQPDKKLAPLAQHIHQLAKQLQLEHIYQIATHYQDTLQ